MKWLDNIFLIKLIACYNYLESFFTLISLLFSQLFPSKEFTSGCGIFKIAGHWESRREKAIAKTFVTIETFT